MQAIATTALVHGPWRMRLGRSWRGLCYLSLGDDRDGLERHVHRYFGEAEVVEDAQAFASDAEQLRAYLEGEGRGLAIDLDLRGTSFQVAVWRALLRLPYGTTATYGEVARAVRMPRAARAVGQAVHVNPVAIVVPCHRVVASGGRIGGYGGGLAIKRRLLDLEGVPPLSD